MVCKYARGARIAQIRGNSASAPAMKFVDRVATVFGFKREDIPYYRNLAFVTIGVFSAIYAALDLARGPSAGFQWREGFFWIGILALCVLLTSDRMLIPGV